MIIWINGSFGVGKTTIAIKLKELLDNSFMYDPENIGAFLSENLKYGYSDYQEYSLWRILNYEIITDLLSHYKNIIVPMTLTNIEYYKQIIGKLKNNGANVLHIILEADKDTIISRLDNRPDTTPWSYLQIDRCIKAFEKDITGEKIDTSNKDIEEVVTIIMKKIKNVE